MEMKQLNEELIAEQEILKKYGDTMLEQYNNKVPKDLLKKLVDMKMKRYKGETISERDVYADIHENSTELSDEELYKLIQNNF